MAPANNIDNTNSDEGRRMTTESQRLWRLAPRRSTMRACTTVAFETTSVDLVDKMHLLLDLHVAFKDQLDLSDDLQWDGGAIECCEATEFSIDQQLQVCVASCTARATRKSTLLSQDAEAIFLDCARFELLVEFHATFDLVLCRLATRAET
eukprot:CAMPEP_0206425238 /NCGR_PEP_ID=MMETSP0324_2-20121206/3679_1 /ASSEMBLY_ACC=CAM_ASM_000836 /TAXON_ID=2866 /ORGANISM="Crypthecodinium cohnii, Strain Seligo" /LENGTH=150 /DNA_ID=CAMNT_0053889995 /DNA_START=119 /DNA_END=571 /DNA_ORIENTATION=+